MLPFCHVDHVLCFTELFSFRRSHLLIVSLSVYADGFIFRKWSLVPMCSSVLSTFSSIRFSVVGFMLRSLIDLDMSFVHGDRYGSIFVLLHVHIQLCQHHLLNMLSFFPFDIFCSLQKLGVRRCVCLYLGLLFGSIHPLVSSNHHFY